ncbi:peroxisomal acyl-coenzyme A oxidase 3 isoform X4 [Panthera pardus]|uniref:Acyl-coenzyme A oxidase n=1 Tax=Panthera pardus TaxID=9691 RepID=A0A9V1FVU2_PANPR|nr:peroxisomal acyl-coenzyme A oxidase 3 isoform X4 [Panthera pardus]
MAAPSEGDAASLLPDLPGGPLQAYRARASFCWKELALFLEGEDMLRLKKSIFSALEDDPLFARSRGHELSLEKHRELTFLRCKRVLGRALLRVEDMVRNPLSVLTLITCLGTYDWSLAQKFLLHLLVFGFAIYKSGSERHLEYLPKILSMEIFGCFAVTEVSHGSNAKAIRTTAHYDPATEEFILHSPDFEAAKFWVGNMGKTATHAVVFAQLYTPGGRCHGLHSFLVQIRNPKTLLPMPGVMVGDIGKKLGLNGIDNGFAMFHKVRIPRRALLNQTGDVTPEGTYVTPFKAELGREIHALVSGSKPLASWTAQRGIQECREACGGHGYLAVNRLGDLRNENDPNCTYEGDNNVLLQQTSGYLLGLLELRLQGGARLESPLGTVDFLEAYPDILDQRFSCPSVAGCLESSVPLAAYEWLVCYLLRESVQKVNQEKRSGSSDFEARNNSQVYRCRSLALAFLELTVVRRFHEYVHQPGVPPPLRATLQRLSALYALWSLNQHTALLYRGGYFSDEQAGKMIENTILNLCAQGSPWRFAGVARHTDFVSQQLKDDAVALVDVIAPPDFILDSPIGRADGELYKNLWTAVLQESKVLERASWWAEFPASKTHVESLKSRL